MKTKTWQEILDIVSKQPLCCRMHNGILVVAENDNAEKLRDLVEIAIRRQIPDFEIPENFWVIDHRPMDIYFESEPGVISVVDIFDGSVSHHIESLEGETVHGWSTEELLDPRKGTGIHTYRVSL